MITLSIGNAIAYGYIFYSIKNFTKPSSFKMATRWFFTCGKCVTFWAALIATGGDLVFAAIASLTVLLLETFIVTKL
jgi:hypothetical protein